MPQTLTIFRPEDQEMQAFEQAVDDLRSFFRVAFSIVDSSVPSFSSRLDFYRELIAAEGDLDRAVASMHQQEAAGFADANAYLTAAFEVQDLAIALNTFLVQQLGLPRTPRQMHVVVTDGGKKVDLWKVMHIAETLDNLHRGPFAQEIGHGYAEVLEETDVTFDDGNDVIKKSKNTPSNPNVSPSSSNPNPNPSQVAPQQPSGTPAGGGGNKPPDPDASADANSQSPTADTLPETTMQPLSNPNPPSPMPSGGNPITTGGPPNVPIPQVVGITNVQPAQQRYIGGRTVPVGGNASIPGGDGDFGYGFGPGDGGYYGGSKQKGKSTVDGNVDRYGKDGGTGGGGHTGEGGDPEPAGHQTPDPGGGVGGGGAGGGSKGPPSGGTAPGGPSGPVDGDPPTPPPTPDVITGADPPPPKAGPKPSSDPGPDDDGGGESKPSIPYGPHHSGAFGSQAPRWLAMDRHVSTVADRLMRMRLARFGVSGYASGDDLGAAGYNPRFNPDPESGGGAAPIGGGEGPTGGVAGGDPGGFGGGDGGPSMSGGSDMSNVAGSAPTGPDPDNEWGAGGYNPHYQPSGGYSWTPYSRNNGSNALQQPASRVRLVRGAGSGLSRAR